MADSQRRMLVAVLLVAAVSTAVARAPDSPRSGRTGSGAADVSSLSILGTKILPSSAAASSASKAVKAASRVRDQVMVTYAKLLEPRSPGDAELWKQGIVVTDIPHFPNKAITYSLRLRDEEGAVAVTAVDTAKCPVDDFYLRTGDMDERHKELGEVRAGSPGNFVTTCPVQGTSLITVFLEWMKAVNPTMSINLLDNAHKVCWPSGMEESDLDSSEEFGVPLSALQFLLKGQTYYEKFGFAYPSLPSGPAREKIRSELVSAYLRNPASGDSLSRQGSSGSLSRQGSSGSLSRQGSSGSLKREGSAGNLQRQGSLSSIGSSDFAPRGGAFFADRKFSKQVATVLGATDALKYQQLLAKGTVQQLAAFLNDRVVFLPAFVQSTSQKTAVAAQAKEKRVLCDALIALADAAPYLDTSVTRPAGTH